MFINEQFRFRRIRTMQNRMLWHINDFCNFGCSYCFFPKFAGETPGVGRLSPEEIYDALNKTGRKWHLYISGGEPFLYPKFNELIQLIKQDHPVQISTNLYNKNVQLFADTVTPDNIIVINASLHLPHHNEKSLKKFIQNYRLFDEKGFDIAVSYVTHPSLMHRIKDDFKYLRDEGVKYVLPLTFNGEYNGKRYPGNYSIQEIKTLSEIYQEPLELLVVLDKMRFEGKMCKAGADYFSMDIHGNVSRCITIPESFGNLYDGTFVPGTEIRPCTSSTCYDHCHGMMSLVEEPAAPVVEIAGYTVPDTGFLGNTYSVARSMIQDIVPERKRKPGIQVVSDEIRKEFIRTTPTA